jgi:hypothetical protein
MELRVFGYVVAAIAALAVLSSCGVAYGSPVPAPEDPTSQFLSVMAGKTWVSVSRSFTFDPSGGLKGSMNGGVVHYQLQNGSYNFVSYATCAYDFTGTMNLPDSATLSVNATEPVVTAVTDGYSSIGETAAEVCEAYRKTIGAFKMGIVTYDGEHLEANSYASTLNGNDYYMMSYSSVGMGESSEYFTQKDVPLDIMAKALLTTRGVYAMEGNGSMKLIVNSGNHTVTFVGGLCGVRYVVGVSDWAVLNGLPTIHGKLLQSSETGTNCPELRDMFKHAGDLGIELNYYVDDVPLPSCELGETYLELATPGNDNGGFYAFGKSNCE